MLVITGASPTVADGTYVAALDAMRGEVYAAPVTIAAGGVTDDGSTLRLSADDLERYARGLGARVAGPGRALDLWPHARGLAGEARWWERHAPVDLTAWEPDYGRLAEAQVRWEAAHGRPLRAS